MKSEPSVKSAEHWPFLDSACLIQAVRKAVAMALRRHTCLGERVVVVEDGQLRIVEACDIPEEVCAPLPSRKALP